MTRNEKIKELLQASGIPKICVSVIGNTQQQILDRIAEMKKESTIDLIEWRIDFYENVKNFQEVLTLLSKMRNILTEIPLLVTFRSKKEGGETEISFEDYRSLLLEIARSKQTDFIDVEVLMCPEQTAALVHDIKELSIYVIGSNHNFDKTPETSEIGNRLEEMLCYYQVDIPKIAVMPQSANDVLKLLSATVQIKEKYPNQPLITMSMGGKGLISRLSGELFGSAVTFGALGEASAPGQIPITELRETLELIHKNI